MFKQYKWVPDGTYDSSEYLVRYVIEEGNAKTVISKSWVDEGGHATLYFAIHLIYFCSRLFGRAVFSSLLHIPINIDRHCAHLFAGLEQLIHATFPHFAPKPHINVGVHVHLVFVLLVFQVLALFQEKCS